MDHDKIVSVFETHFDTADGAWLVRAPGRVNLIGEHTDYNDGFVLPIAIDREICIVCRPNGSREVRLHSLDFDEDAAFGLDSLRFDEDKRWTNYVQGVASVLQNEGMSLIGFDGVVAGDVPIGAGLSSSAAFEVATAMAFEALCGLEIERSRMARLCQRAENEFVGVNCGIMDQYVSLFAQAGHAVLIDCRSLEHEIIPVGQGEARIVVCDTGVKHELASSEYNTRRKECETAARILGEQIEGLRALRDVSLSDFEAHADQLPEVVRKRARHVIAENQRTLDSVEALRRDDLAAFGQLMIRSHESLRDDYEVSCEELDLMVELALKAPGVFGARMTGGGFGGCTVNLVKAEAVDTFAKTVRESYSRDTGHDPEVYVCEPGPGASARRLP